MKDEAELQFQIDMLESFDADSDEQLNAQMIVWLKELQHRRAAMLNSEPVSSGDGWISVDKRMPEELGRYWCYVEEQNSLGKSHYQWNFSWNGDEWGGEGFFGRVTHWMPLPAAPKPEVKGD